MSNQILIIDDDLKLSTLLQQLFDNNGFLSFYALDAFEAREMLAYIKFDALVVDYMMPKENGIEFLNSIRNSNIYIPSLMLTAIDDIENKLNALTSACDDYLTKPFNSEELILRVKNLVKRKQVNSSYATTNDIIKIGNMDFNKATHTLKVGNIDINLSTTEEEIFNIFVENINIPLEKEDILRQLGKNINDITLNTLNVSIMRLRKKIEIDTNHPKYIKTIRGKGFVLITH